MYNKNYGFNMKPCDINCDGCKSDTGRLISYCRTCEIKKCGQTRGIADCTHCPDQPCDKLKKFHAFSPEAKKVFDALLT